MHENRPKLILPTRRKPIYICEGLWDWKEAYSEKKAKAKQAVKDLFLECEFEDY